MSERRPAFWDWLPVVLVALLVVVAIAIFTVVKFFEFVGSQN
jgi:hypothetical protein